MCELEASCWKDVLGISLGAFGKVIKGTLVQPTRSQAAAIKACEIDVVVFCLLWSTLFESSKANEPEASCWKSVGGKYSEALGESEEENGGADGL